jgi:hypothetical protein
VEDDAPGLSTEEQRPTVVEASLSPLQIRPIRPRDDVKPSDSSIPVLQPEISVDSDTQDIVKRSPVKALRGILKKPRRHSKDTKFPEIERIVAESNNVNPAGQSMVPNVPSQRSDEDYIQPNPSPELQTRVSETIDRSSYRGSLQMAAFDRILFAKRGAELRNEYMREFGEE